MRIGMDIDDVISDFGRYFLQYLNLEQDMPTEWHDERFRKNFHKIENDVQFWQSIPCLYKSFDLKFAPWCFITARSPHLEGVTKMWLSSMAGFPPSIPLFLVGPGGDKATVAKQFGCTHFIDDNVDHYDNFRQNGIECYLMNASHNASFDTDYRIFDPNEIIKYGRP